MISRIADSDTARTVACGSRRLNRNFAGSLMFQTTWKSMSTMFSSVVSISPLVAAVGRGRRRCPRSARASPGSPRAVTNGQGAKFRPGLPVCAELAEEQLDRLLFRPDRVERGEEPQRRPAPARPARCVPRSKLGTAAAARRRRGRRPRPPISTRSCSWPFLHDLVDLGDLRRIALPGGAAAAPVVASVAAVAAAAATRRRPRVLRCCPAINVLSLRLVLERLVIATCVLGRGNSSRPHRLSSSSPTLPPSSDGPPRCGRNPLWSAPIFTAIPASWIISPASGATI